MHRYPVKSMQGESLPWADVGDHGVVGDRRFGVFDTGTGRVLSAKEEPRLLLARARTVDGTVEVEAPGGERGADAVLSAWLGRQVVVREADRGMQATYQSNVDALDDQSAAVEWRGPHGSFHDEAPVHVLTTAALRAMAVAAPGQQWVERRFRPNLVIDVDGDGFVEDGWVGGHLRIGEVVLEVFKATTRCSMIGRAQPEADREVIRAVRDHHGLKLGVHARVVVGGRIEAGAGVERVEG